MAAQAELWVLQTPTVSASLLRRRGLDPDVQHLIRLVVVDEVCLPTFQFDWAAEPIPVVLQVNRLLDAEHDPCGVADWWLGTNASLGAVPATLIGRRDPELIAAAAALVGG